MSAERSRVTESRRAALEALRAVREGDLADRALERVAGEIPARERAWTQELVYGTLRLRARLDHVLEEFVRGGTGALEPDVLDVLRLGVYQLLEMGSVPAYAAVSQSVELARAAGAARAAGLVNGVLQAVRREGGRVRFPDAERDPVGHLAAWGSHPRWLLERWIARWGVQGARGLVEANNQRPELYLRPLGIGTPEALERLRGAGLAAEGVAFSPDSVRLGEGVGVREALATIPAVVQDPAAALVVTYTDPPGEARVLDLCAAPGGKALGLATRARFVAAADLSLGRLVRLRENMARVELAGRVGAVAADARHPPFRPAEVVLLDAPCTGTGTLRRHPDGRWRVGPEALAELARLQGELIEAAASLVLLGGLLVYSTCSLEPEENEDQVERFLAEHPEFRRERGAAVDPGLLDDAGQLYVLPQREGVDGSFAARLRRVE